MIYVYHVVQLRNGRFWSPQYPEGQASPHASMCWGRGATKASIERDIVSMCRRFSTEPPHNYRIRVVHAELVEKD